MGSKKSTIENKTDEEEHGMFISNLPLLNPSKQKLQKL